MYLLIPNYYQITSSLLQLTDLLLHGSVHLHYLMITSITTITTEFHYYIIIHYSHYFHFVPPNLDMFKYVCVCMHMHVYVCL